MLLMSINLRRKEYKNGKTAFYLDIYHNGKRSYEFIREVYLITKPKSSQDRENNKLADETAKGILAKRQLQIANEEYNFEDKTRKKASFIKYFQHYTETYNKKDFRKSISALKSFKGFLENKDITFSLLTDALVNSFKDYLEANKKLTGETPCIYLTQLKKVIRKAYKEGIIKKPFGEDIKIPRSTTIRKDILTSDELKRLGEAYCGNADVKRAFLFSCNTGLRYVDINRLTWKFIKQGEDGLMLQMNQSKTGKPVKVYLNDGALKYLGGQLPSNKLIFELPTHTAILKNLKNWAKEAKVEKNITYHVARHTFGTLLAHGNANLKTISSLLGHSSLNYTNLYVRESEAQKQKAVNNLPIF